MRFSLFLLSLSLCGIVFSNKERDQIWISDQIRSTTRHFETEGNVTYLQKEAFELYNSQSNESDRRSQLLTNLKCRTLSSLFVLCEKTTQSSSNFCKSSEECLFPRRNDAIQIGKGNSAFEIEETTSLTLEMSAKKFIMARLPRIDGKEPKWIKTISMKTKLGGFFPNLIGISPSGLLLAFSNPKNRFKTMKVEAEIDHGSESRAYELHIRMNEEENLESFEMSSMIFHHIFHQFSSRSENAEERMGTRENLKMISYNIWNWNNEDPKLYMPWQSRLKAMALVISQENPDFIAFQEIREGPNRRNQLEVIAENVQKLNLTYQYFYLRSAPQPEDTFEGIGLFVRKGMKILSKSFTRLTHDDCDDLNTRSVLSLSVHTGRNQIRFTGTHWSYSGQCQMINARETFTFLKNKTSSPSFLLGDLNIYPAFPDPLEWMTGKADPQKYGKKQGNMRDIFAELNKNTSYAGYTFPSFEGDTRGNTRCDIIMGRGGTNAAIQPSSFEVIASRPFYNYQNPTLNSPSPDSKPYWTSDHRAMKGVWTIIPRMK